MDDFPRLGVKAANSASRGVKCDEEVLTCRRSAVCCSETSSSSSSSSLQSVLVAASHVPQDEVSRAQPFQRSRKQRQPIKDGDFSLDAATTGNDTLHIKQSEST